MIPVSKYKEYFRLAVASIDALRDMVTVVDENHLSKVVKEKTSDNYPMLVVVYPSATTRAQNADSIMGHNTGLLFVLLPMQDRSRSDHDYEKELQQASTIMTQLLGKMRLDMEACDFMSQLHTDGIRVEPEYNFVGHIGVSITFSFDTLPVW